MASRLEMLMTGLNIYNPTRVSWLPINLHQLINSSIDY